MSEIGPIGGGASTQGASRPRQSDAERPGQHAEPRAARRGEDRVEVSALAQSLARVNQEAQVRQDLVDRVRAQIEAGTYDTPERVDGAIERILREVDPSV